ncbi:hypothetical protein GX48_05915 [Paracoccidioides brasiliensis]|nr:hypothetical protein GX48_05915 [Paracoccidioides brasiliensis]
MLPPGTNGRTGSSRVEVYYQQSVPPPLIPLPLFSPIPTPHLMPTSFSPTPIITSNPFSQPIPHPLSPAPTVLVSLRAIGCSQASSSGLSLHQYRKNLSCPSLDEAYTTTLGPRRPLRRKPKALNLNLVRSREITPLPSVTPLSTSPVSPSRSSAELVQTAQLLESHPVPCCEQRDFPTHSPYCSLTEETVILRRINTSPTVLNSSSGYHPSYPPRSPPPPYTPTAGIPSGSSRIRRLKAFRNQLKRIPAKLISHGKSCSESGLSLCSNQLKSQPNETQHQYRGVSFEILNRPKLPCLLSLTSDPNPTDLFKDNTSASLFNTMSAPGQSFPGSHPPLGEQTPLRRSSQVRSRSEERRPTPPRALFEDLPTAHSSITSRITSQRSNVFPLFPYIDHAVVDWELEQELAFEPTIEEHNIEFPSNQPGSPISYSVENEASEQTLKVLPPQEVALSPTPAPVEDDSDDDEGDIKNLDDSYSNTALSVTSAGQPSNYYSSLRSRSDSRLNGGAIRRNPSKVTKMQMPNHKRSISSPLDRLSKELEECFINDENAVSERTYPAPKHPFERSLEAADAAAHVQRQSSIYSTGDTLSELCNQALADSIHAGDGSGPYDIDPRLSDDFSYDHHHMRHCQYRLGSISSPNFSKPMHLRDSEHPEPSTRTSTLEFPISYSSVDNPNLHHSNWHTRRVDNTSNSSIPATIEIGPGTLQSSSITGIADYEFVDEEHDDMGPGSSQTASSRQLSVLGTLSTLKSRFRFPSTLSSSRSNGAKGGDGLKSQSFNMYALSAVYKKQVSDQMEGHGAFRSGEEKGENSKWYGQSDDNDGGYDDAQDWQTVACSQQFRSAIKCDFSRIDTGSSLANYSSYGSLANAEPKLWTMLTSPGEPQQQFPSCPFNTNPVALHTGQKGLAHSHKPHQNPELDQGVLLPENHHAHDHHNHSATAPVTTKAGLSFLDSNNSRRTPAPVLAASTAVTPAPLASSSSRYQHPTPLQKPHTHPFQHPPPVLDKGRGRLRKHSLYQQPTPSRFGPGPSGSGKFNFFDFSYHQQHQPQQQKQATTTAGAATTTTTKPCRWQQSSVTDSVGPAATATASSDWCTVSSSAQEVSASGQDPYPSYYPKENPLFSSRRRDTTTTTPIAQHTKNIARRKKAFSHKYPSMPKFGTEETKEANYENTSQHSLPLTASTHSAPRDYSSANRKQKEATSVPKMPERAHPTPRYDSTDRLILDQRSIPPTPPRYPYGHYYSIHSSSLASESRFQQQHGQQDARRPSVTGARTMSCGLRWLLTQDTITNHYSCRNNTDTNDQQDPNRCVRAPSRNDYVRERIRQLDEPINAAALQHARGRYASRTTTTNTNTKPSTNNANPTLHITHERARNIPPRPFNVAVRPVINNHFDVDEEYHIGDWHYSEHGQYAFSTAPRLYKTSAIHKERAAITGPNTNFVLQRRVGRQLVISATAFLPLGWFVLGYIALLGHGADWLVHWRSRGEAIGFHYKEVRFARRAAGGVLISLVIVGLVIGTIVAALHENDS